MPFMQGYISFGQYLRGEYSFLGHSHYLAIFFLYLDYRFLQLDMNYFTYVGLLFYLLGYALILSYAKSFLHVDTKQNIAALLIGSVGYFCITSDFPWLLVVFEYVYFFITIATLIALDLYLRGKIRFRSFLGCAIFCLLFADSIGMAAVFMCIVALTCHAFFSKNYKPLAILIAVIAVIFATQYFLLGKGVPIGGHSRLETLKAILANPIDILISFISIFSQPLIDKSILHDTLGEKNAPILQFGLGLVGFIFVCGVLLAYHLNKGWQKTKLPLLLIGYGLLNWALIFVSRYLDFGAGVMNEQRYVRLFTLIYVGTGMAIVCTDLHRIAFRFVAAAAACFVLTYAITTSYKFWQDQYIQAYFENAKVELVNDNTETSTLANYIGRCTNDYCKEAIDFMKEEKLSIFNAPEK